MSFDLTALTGTQVAILTVAITALGAITVAIVSAISAVVTAAINARSTRKLDYLKAVRSAKTIQLRLFRRTLRTRIRGFITLRNAYSKSDAEHQLREPLFGEVEAAFLPLFLSTDPFVKRLVDLANEQQAHIYGIVGFGSEILVPEARIEVNNLLHTLITLNHFAESFALQDTADPTRYNYRLRIEAVRYFRGYFPALRRYSPFDNPPSRPFGPTVMDREGLALVIAMTLAIIAGYLYAGVGGALIAVPLTSYLALCLSPFYLEPSSRIRLIGVLVLLIVGWLSYRFWDWHPHPFAGLLSE